MTGTCPGTGENSGPHHLAFSLRIFNPAFNPNALVSEVLDSRYNEVFGERKEVKQNLGELVGILENVLGTNREYPIART